MVHRPLHEVLDDLKDEPVGQMVMRNVFDATMIQFDTRLDSVEARMGRMETDISEIKNLLNGRWANR